MTVKQRHYKSRYIAYNGTTFQHYLYPLTEYAWEKHQLRMNPYFNKEFEENIRIYGGEVIMYVQPTHHVNPNFWSVCGDSSNKRETFKYRWVKSRTRRGYPVVRTREGHVFLVSVPMDYVKDPGATAWVQHFDVEHMVTDNGLNKSQDMGFCLPLSSLGSNGGLNRPQATALAVSNVPRRHHHFRASIKGKPLTIVRDTTRRMKT